MFETESEAWDAVADTLEMIEGMPEWEHDDPAMGLCEVRAMLCTDGLLSDEASMCMNRRLDKALQGREWLARPGAWKPRVTIARKFAKAARNA